MVYFYSIGVPFKNVMHTLSVFNSTIRFIHFLNAKDGHILSPLKCVTVWIVPVVIYLIIWLRITASWYLYDLTAGKMWYELTRDNGFPLICRPIFGDDAAASTSLFNSKMASNSTSFPFVSPFSYHSTVTDLVSAFTFDTMAPCIRPEKDRKRWS